MEGSYYIYYATGLLTTLSILLLWFYSPLQITLGQIFLHKNLYSLDQVNTALMLRNKFLAKLTSCYICFSFWTSLAVGLVFTFFFDAPNYFSLLTFFTYPCIAYYYKTLIDRKP